MRWHNQHAQFYLWRCPVCFTTHWVDWEGGGEPVMCGHMNTPFLPEPGGREMQPVTVDDNGKPTGEGNGWEAISADG